MLPSSFSFGLSSQLCPLSFNFSLALGLFFSPKSVLLLYRRLFTALGWSFGRRSLCRRWRLFAARSLTRCCHIRPSKHFWQIERSFVFRLAAILNALCHTLCKSFEVLKTLPEDVKAIDVQALLAADASNKHPDSEYLAQDLALRICMAHLLLRVLIKSIPVFLGN